MVQKDYPCNFRCTFFFFSSIQWFYADISLLFSNLEIEMIALLFIFLGLEPACPRLNLDVDGRSNEFSEAANADGTSEFII